MAIDPSDIHPRLRVALAETAQETGKTEAQLLGEALEAYLGACLAGARWNPAGTFSERAEQLGLFGCIEVGLADLSTNKDHMADLGKW